MAQSDSRFGYRAKLSRTDHDLSRQFGFTCAPGQLLPVHADILTPHESVYIDHDLTFLRTAPLAAPAMIDVKVHYETFFVPMQMIYQPFENTIFSINQLQSSLYNLNNLQNNNFPLFNYSGFVTTITNSTYQRTSAHMDAFRLADMFDLNAPCMAFDANNPSLNDYKPSFFPWQLLAYHTIFNYYYRLDDKTQFSHACCNYDKFYASTSAVDGNNFDMMRIHYRPWKFDYYTSLYRSPIVSSENMQAFAGSYVSDLVNSSVGRAQPISSNGGFFGNVNSSMVAESGSALTTYTPSSINANSSTALIRQMFANERLAMITGRTRKTYDSQVLAHFGIKVPHDPKHDIARIGHDVFDLQIGEVTSLAGTSTAALGDLAGKGWSSSYRNGNNIAEKHEFVAPCHGVVMTIFSIEPKRRYYGGFHKQNAVSNIFDFPVPEFDRMGNQPIFRYEIGNRNSDSLLGTVTQMTDQVGWNLRYQQWKKRASRTTLAFMSGNAYGGTNVWNSYMITTLPFAIADVSNPSNYDNVSRPDLEGRFYIDRHCTDPLMLVPFADGWKQSETGEDWNSSPWMVYARDPFIVDSHEVVKKVSWMSKDGEPVYNW